MTAAASSSRNPVLLIHGINDTIAKFRTMKPYLERLGWSVHALNLIPNHGAAGLDMLARQVDRYIAERFPPDHPIDLVGFSMGGLVSRYYVQRLGGIERVHRVVTLSSPHYGTHLARVRLNLGGSQMRRGSTFLADLNQDVALLERINFTSIWTPMDFMILPAHSSRLPVGREFIVPVPLHSWMVRDRRSLALVADCLTEPLRPTHWLVAGAPVSPVKAAESG